MDIARIGRVVALLCATFLAGCGGGSNDDTSSGGANTTPPLPVSTYTVGGTVSGLAGTGLVLRDNGADNLAVSASGSFKFATALASGTSYSVTIFTQPASPSQTCATTSNSGTLSASNVTNVTVTCTTNTYKVGGSISGLQGTGLVLQDNNGDNLTVAAGASIFTFGTAVASGAPYSVTVLTQPSTPAETCSVTNASGAVAATDVTTVQLSCTASSSSGSGTSSSGDLIDAAVKAGTITLETAIEYKMFALFKDARLPTAYHGNDSDLFETDAFDLVWKNWGTLSDAAVQTLLPFLVPPAYQGSWMSPQAATVHTEGFRPQVDLSNYPCRLPVTDMKWQAKIGATFKVWYDAGIPGADAQASLARDALEGEILTGVTKTMGMKSPLSDVAIAGCNGGDGLYDVYLVDMAAAAVVTDALGENETAQGPCGPGELPDVHSRQPQPHQRCVEGNACARVHACQSMGLPGQIGRPEQLSLAQGGDGRGSDRHRLSHAALRHLQVSGGDAARALQGGAVHEGAGEEPGRSVG